jgi:serine/threonine protein kinase
MSMRINLKKSHSSPELPRYRIGDKDPPKVNRRSLMAEMREKRLRKNRQTCSDTKLDELLKNGEMYSDTGEKHKTHRRIGSGSNAHVYEIDVDDMVVKLPSNLEEPQSQKDFKAEVKILRKTDSPRVVKYFGTVSNGFDGETVGVLLEKCENGDLHKYMLSLNKIGINDKIMYKWCQNLLESVKYIHSQSIIHRDIKSPNLLVDKDLNLKLADFGLARKNNIKNRGSTLRQLRTSPCWAAPELLDGDLFINTFSSDIFAMTITLWEIIHFYYIHEYEIPYKAQNPFFIFGYILNGQRPNIEEIENEVYIEFLEKGWNQNPKERLIASDMSNEFEQICS